MFKAGNIFYHEGQNIYYMLVSSGPEYYLIDIINGVHHNCGTYTPGRECIATGEPVINIEEIRAHFGKSTEVNFVYEDIIGFISHKHKDTVREIQSCLDLATPYENRAKQLVASML